MKPEIATWVRTCTLLIALVNQMLVLGGYNTLPFTEEEMTAGLTAIFTAAASLWTWWKNNSFTDAAKKGDEVKRAIQKSAG